MLESSYRYKIFALVTVIPFYVWLYRYINLDFFYDETFTLIQYVFVPLKTTVDEYLNSNNHYLSNLINNVYLKILGEDNIYTLMDHPWVIRLWQLPYTIITIVVFYRLCEKFFNKHIAIFSIILLTTSIPYYNFALQVRGYSLSIMLLCIVLYCLWNFEQRFRWIDGLLLTVAGAFFIYSMPSNIYTFIGIGFFYLLEAVLYYVRKNGGKTSKSSKRKEETQSYKKTFIVDNKNTVILFFLSLGFLIALILFSPLVKGMMNDPHLKSQGIFYKPTLLKMLPSVLNAFISWRYFIVVLGIAGIVRCAIARKTYDSEFLRKVLFCVLVIVTPFIVSFIRGDHPYDRHFVNLLPVFCLFISLGMYFLFANKITKVKLFYIAIALFLYAQLTFAWSIYHIENKLMDDIKNGKMSVSLLYNYFQAHYAPKELTELLVSLTEDYRRDTFPLGVYYCDRLAMTQYLKKFQFKKVDINKFDSYLNMSNNWIIISAGPYRFQDEFSLKYPDYELKRLNDELQFHNIFLMSKKK